MTPADRLRAQAAELLRLADELDGAARPATPRRPDPDRWIDTGAAARVSGLSYSTLYRLARRYGLGRRLPSGSWRFSERALRAYVRGEIDEKGDAPRLPMATVFDHG